ncbi:MAG: alpha/beta hydrolase [Desulfovibrio sp.]|nr:alpha/beta hydrolase [Desulfovibrio sp.]
MIFTTQVSLLATFSRLGACLILLLLTAAFPTLCPARTHLERPPSEPVPETVSPQLKKLLGVYPLCSFWHLTPVTATAWKDLVNKVSVTTAKEARVISEKLKVSVRSASMGHVPVFDLLPSEIAHAHDKRILLHVHGGAYVLNPGISGTSEGSFMAHFGKIRVISVDYRMPPDYPYPAALDDVVSVYRELLKTYPAKSIGVFGSSTGGGLTLALVLKLKELGLPLPAAIAPGSPWSDLNKIGDSYFTHEGLDNSLVTYDYFIKSAAELYAAGHDLKDPLLSPVYGDVTGFPPVMLTSGTRDLFLSNTVRMHLKLREAGVPADLMVFEGMSHVLYMIDPEMPETKLHFSELSKFFDRAFEAH